ncbi:MAG: choice-of-anchor R domain-containing protein [Terrimicrobiaceae bacterium]
MTARKLFFISAIGFVISATVGNTQAATIFDNTVFTQNGAQGIQVPDLSGSGSYAQAFSTTAQDATITEIQFLLSTFSAGSYSVDIYASDGFIPTGPILANVFSGSTSFTSPRTVSGLNITLAPSTQYFIAASVTSGSLLWSYTNANTAPNTTLNASNDGNGWVTSNSEPLQMKVTAVPEPSIGILLAVAGCAAAVFRRYRRSPARP